MGQNWWRGISRTADLLQIGYVVIPLVVTGALLLWRGGEVPVWTLALALLPAAVLGLLAIRWKRIAQKAPGDTTTVDLEVARGYLRQIQDILGEIEHVLAGPGSVEEDRQRLTKLRELVFVAVSQGIHSERGEKVRCVYLEPAQEGGRAVLKPKYHHGHSPRVEELRLNADHTSVAGAAYLDRASIHVEDTVNDPRMQRTEDGRKIGTLTCVPIRFGRATADPMGVFSVASSRTSAFLTPLTEIPHPRSANFPTP